MQALPAVATTEQRMQEAEPRRQCVPRQEPGNERFRGGDQREVSKIYEGLSAIVLSFNGKLSPS